jgi:hypothetical protein
MRWIDRSFARSKHHSLSKALWKNKRKGHDSWAVAMVGEDSLWKGRTVFKGTQRRKKKKKKKVCRRRRRRRAWKSCRGKWGAMAGDAVKQSDGE